MLFFVINYVQFNLGKSFLIYKSLYAPKILQDIVESGLKIPFLTISPKIYLPDNKSSMIPEQRP